MGQGSCGHALVPDGGNCGARTPHMNSTLRELTMDTCMDRPAHGTTHGYRGQGACCSRKPHLLLPASSGSLGSGSSAPCRPGLVALGSRGYKGCSFLAPKDGGSSPLALSACPGRFGALALAGRWISLILPVLPNLCIVVSVDVCGVPMYVCLLAAGGQALPACLAVRQCACCSKWVYAWSSSFLCSYAQSHAGHTVSSALTQHALLASSVQADKTAT